MSYWTEHPERRLIAMAIALLAVVLAGEAYHHGSLKPVTLPTLLFELLEVVLMVGCTVACTLMILQVRVREMVAALAAMLVILLAGELYLGVKPLTPPMLLVELLEVALVVGISTALALLVRRTR